MSSPTSPCSAWTSWAGQRPACPSQALGHLLFHGHEQRWTGELPWGLHPCLSQKESTHRTVSLSQPTGAGGASPQIQPASRSLYLQNTFPICWPVKLPPVGNPACTAGLQRNNVDQNTFLQGRRKAAGLQAEVPVVCRKAFQWSYPRCPSGWHGAPGMQSCPP